MLNVCFSLTTQSFPPPCWPAARPGPQTFHWEERLPLPLQHSWCSLWLPCLFHLGTLSDFQVIVGISYSFGNASHYLPFSRFAPFKFYFTLHSSFSEISKGEERNSCTLSLFPFDKWNEAILFKFILLAYTLGPLSSYFLFFYVFAVFLKSVF